MLRVFRALSSAWLEHLPYKQGVTGSSPVVPTDVSCYRKGIYRIRHPRGGSWLYMFLYMFGLLRCTVSHPTTRTAIWRSLLPELRGPPMPGIPRPIRVRAPARQVLADIIGGSCT